MLTVVLVLAVLALLLAVGSAATGGRVPLWVAVVLVCILEIVRALPLR